MTKGQGKNCVGRNDNGFEMTLLPRVLRPLLLVLAVSGCVSGVEAVEKPKALPVMAWDDQPEAQEWTKSALAALKKHGAPLLSEYPDDITEWCPGYLKASEDERAAFWAGIMSTLTKHESTWNPEATGGGGAWIGLAQISPKTAEGYGCKAQTVAELKDGPANLSCAIRIAAVTVTRDGMVASGREGLAADWAPFLNRKKRAEMVSWTREQPYCQG